MGMEIEDVEQTGTTIRVWVTYEGEDFSEMTEIEATRMAEDMLDCDSSETIVHHDESTIEILFT